MSVTCKGFVIVGNDTEIGKTTIACQIIELLRRSGKVPGAYKPTASGFHDDDSRGDAQRLLSATGQSYSLDVICPYRFSEPVAPLLAAQRLGIELSDRTIDAGLTWWLSRCQALIVETAGGLMSPLSANRTNLDFCQAAALASIVVIENRLGAVNQANLVCNALLSRHLPIAAVVFNKAKPYNLSDDTEHLVLHSNPDLFVQQFWQNFAIDPPPCFQLAYAEKLQDNFIDALQI